MACPLSAWHNILDRKAVRAGFPRKETWARQMTIIVGAAEILHVFLRAWPRCPMLLTSMASYLNTKAYLAHRVTPLSSDSSGRKEARNLSHLRDSARGCWQNVWKASIGGRPTRWRPCPRQRERQNRHGEPQWSNMLGNARAAHYLAHAARKRETREKRAIEESMRHDVHPTAGEHYPKARHHFAPTLSSAT